MARRIRWQIVIAVLSSALVLGLMGYLAVTNAAVPRPLAGGAYVEGVGGIRIEDTVLVTNTGFEILTPTRKDLIQL